MLVLRSVLALAVASVLQILLQRVGNLWGGGVAEGLDLLLVVVVWIALAAGPIAGQTVGMVAGFLSDGLTGGPFGLHAVANTLVGYGVALVRQRVVLQRSVMVLLFAASAAVQQLLIAVLQLLLVAEPELSGASSILVRTLMTAILGGLLLAAESRGHRTWQRWQRRRGSRLRLR